MSFILNGLKSFPEIGGLKSSCKRKLTWKGWKGESMRWFLQREEEGGLRGGWGGTEPLLQKKKLCFCNDG